MTVALQCIGITQFMRQTHLIYLLDLLDPDLMHPTRLHLVGIMVAVTVTSLNMHPAGVCMNHLSDCNQLWNRWMKTARHHCLMVS